MSGGDSNMDIFTLDRQQLSQLLGRPLLDFVPLSPESPCEPRIRPAQETNPETETNVVSIEEQPASSSTMTGTSTTAPKGQQNLQPLVSQQCPQTILYQFLNGQLLPFQNGTKPTTAPQIQSAAGQGNGQEAAQQHGQPLVSQICFQPLTFQLQANSPLLANGSALVPATSQQTVAGQQCGQAVVYQLIQLQPNSQALGDGSLVQPVTSPAQGKHQEIAQPVVPQLQPSMQPVLIHVQTTLPQNSLTSGHHGNRKKVAMQQQSQLLSQQTSQPLTQPKQICLAQSFVGQGNNPEVGQSQVNQHYFQPNVDQLRQPLAEPNYMPCRPQITKGHTRHLLVQEETVQRHVQPSDIQCYVQPQQNSQPYVVSLDQATVQKTRHVLVRQGHHQEEAVQRHAQPSVSQCCVQPQQNSKPAANRSCAISHDQATVQKTRRLSVRRENKSLVNQQPSRTVANLLRRDSRHVCTQPAISRAQMSAQQESHLLVRQGNRQETAAQPRDLPLVQRCFMPPHAARYHPYPPLLTCPSCEQRCYCPTCSYTGPAPPQRCWPTESHDEIQQSAGRHQPDPNNQCACHPRVPQNQLVPCSAGDNSVNFPFSFNQIVNANPVQLNQLIAEQRTGQVRVLNGRMVYEITLQEGQ